MLLAALAALGVPGAPTQLLSGVPLSPAAIVALALVLYAGLALPRIAPRQTGWLTLGFGLVVVVKLAAASAAPPLGLVASYWPAAGATNAPPERSTDFRGLLNTTRIDKSLSFEGEAFPVHFFNDASQFNFGPDQQPARDQLPFFVRWDGWLVVPGDGTRRFAVEAAGTAHLWLDDAEVSSEASLSTGLHAFRVEYARPEARVPRLQVLWQRTVGGPLEPIGGGDVRSQANAVGTELSRALGVLADAGLVLSIAFWLALGLARLRVRRERVGTALLGAIPLLFLAHGMLLHAPMIGRATILSGLDDWLIYESSARDILLNGPVMDGGQGHAAPFYGQPLYPYVLALAHLVTGEGLFGPLVLQFAALGLVVALTAALARRAFGSGVDALAASASLLVLLQLEAEHFKVARQLFTENVYMPLVLASLIVLVALAHSRVPPVWWRALVAGTLLGLTVIARSQFLLFVPLGLLVLVLGWRRRALVPLVFLVAGLVLAIAPVTARNLIVSGQLVPISSSGGASLLEFHRPPPGLIDAAALAREPLYSWLGLDTSTRTVVAFVRADPGGYVQTLLPLGAHSVGLQGRNDPGVYWPLLLTCVVYLFAFALRRTRQLHVWPIHAFVASHLVVLMLFEADTYGYRLVMPMYAPMLAVAAQVPLAALRALFGWARWRAHRIASLAPGGVIERKEDSGTKVPSLLAKDRTVSPPGRSQNVATAYRAARFAVTGWSLVAVVALGFQAKALLDIWPQREASLHGLGGAAVAAVAMADRTAAQTIYVASIDGTPRRFGAGTLPGLRYAWFKWFDPVRSLPLPPEGTTAVYMLNELVGHELAGDLTACLGAPDGSGLTTAHANEVKTRCAGDAPLDLTFSDIAHIQAVRVPAEVQAGETLEARVVWQPLVAHPEPQQLSLQLDDPQAGDATLWGNGTLEPYPARQWQPDEPILTRLPISTESTALPQAYRLTIGIGPTRSGAQQATALWQGTRQERVPVASVTLTPGVSAKMPPDMRLVTGLTSGGLELIGARPLPEEAAIGAPLRVGLLWRAVQDRPQATQFSMQLLRANGDVVQESVMPLLGGRISPSALRAGNVVRDEQSLIVGARVPAETLSLQVAMRDATLKLGQVKMTGRAHTFSESSTEAKADFGGAIALESASVDPANVKPNQKVTIVIKLNWRAEREMAQAYKVFVHVLDPSGENVVAQRDAEPQDGRAPTTGWVSGEVIADQYEIALPTQLSTGDYPIEVGLYAARTGDRLRLPNGDSRALLDTRLHVAP